VGGKGNAHLFAPETPQSYGAARFGSMQLLPRLWVYDPRLEFNVAGWINVRKGGWGKKRESHWSTGINKGRRDA